MEGKKKPGRFTLQFNMEDPQQRSVSGLLEQQGRHKAQFITSAILWYIQTSGLQRIDSNIHAANPEALERVLLKIMEKYPQLAEVSSGELVRTKQTPMVSATSSTALDATLGDDAMTAISETLAAFQQG